MANVLSDFIINFLTRCFQLFYSVFHYLLYDLQDLALHQNFNCQKFFELTVPLSINFSDILRFFHHQFESVSGDFSIFPTEYLELELIHADVG